MDRNRRRHTVTELPSSMRSDGAFRTVNQSGHIRNSTEMKAHYGTPLSIKIPDSEMHYGMNLWNSSHGTQVQVGLQQVGQNYSSCPSSLNGTGCRAFSPRKLGMNPLQQPSTQQPQASQRPFHHPQTQPPFQQPQPQQPLRGWSHVSAFVPTNHWKRLDISKLCQNDRINSIGNIVHSGHQYQNRAASEEKVTKEPVKPPWDQENNENEPRPIVSRKKPVARRRHTVDLVPNQREMGCGGSFNSDRFQATQNLPNPGDRGTSSVPPQDKVTNITQISFDAMLGIISQVANSTNESHQNRTATNTPLSAPTASSFPGTAYTNVLRIDEEPSVPSNNETRRQGPYGQEQTSKVHAKPFPGKTPMYSRVRSHGTANGCFSPGKSQMPTISEDPTASRKSNCDTNTNFVNAMPSTTTQQMHELYRQNFNQNNQSYELNTNPEFDSKQSTQRRQRSTRKKKQPTLESMLGVSDDNPTQSNSLRAHQLFNKSSPITQGMSFNERIDSLTKKWMNEQEKQHTYEFTNAGTGIVASIPANEVPGNSTLDSLEIRKSFDRDSQVQRLHKKNRSPKMSRLLNEPFSNNSLAVTQMPDNKEGVNAAVTNTKNPYGPNEVKSNLRAPKKHIASFTLSGLTPACIYISLPQGGGGAAKRQQEHAEPPASRPPEPRNKGASCMVGPGSRHYDWNSYHFFPDVHDVDVEVLRKRRARQTYKSYAGHSVNLDWLDIRDNVMYDRATNSHHRRHSQGYRVTDYESSDEENQPPPNLQSRTAWNNAVQEYQRQRQEQKRSNGWVNKQHIPIDDNDDDSDSGSDSPKHWQKNPLCVKRTKKRSNARPASGEIYMRNTPHSVDNSPAQLRYNARRLSAPNIQDSTRLSPLVTGKVTPIQQQVKKFEELQQRRRALDSSSDDNEGRHSRHYGSPPKASDLVLVPETATSTNGHLAAPRVIAWRLSPKGHEMMQSQPVMQRHSAYDNMPSRNAHYTTASQQEVTSPVSYFVSSRNEANLSVTGRHSADQFTHSSQANMNGRHSADQLDGYQSHYNNSNNNNQQQPQQRMFSSQQNLSSYQQPMNGYYGNNNNKHVSSTRKPKSHISRRDQDDHPALRQQFRPKSSDDVRWENYLGVDENGRITLDDLGPGDQYHDAYPMDRYQTEEFRNVSSSWENLYDSADLSMVRSETRQVDCAKQPRNKGHVYAGGYQDRPRSSSGPGGDPGYRQIPYSQSDRYGQDNPGYVSPDSDHQQRPGRSSRSRRNVRDKESYDAKALMQEEQQKYAEYKAEYVRRQSSSHSSENEDSRSDQDPYRSKRMVHHERQPAIYGDQGRKEPYQEQVPPYKQHPDQYFYSPQQKRRVPHEQLPVTRAQHVPDVSHYPPNSYVQYKNSQAKTQGPHSYGYGTYQQQAPQAQISRPGPWTPDNRHKYIREYEIPEDPVPKPKQEFILRWGPHQKSPSVERVIGRHTPDRENSRFGPQDKKSHKRSASDGYAHQYDGGMSDRHRSPSVERTEHYSSPDRHAPGRTYHIPGSPRRSPPKKQQHWHYNQTYEDCDVTSPSYDTRNVDVTSPYDTLKSSSSSGHSAPVRAVQQGGPGADLSRHSQSVPAINQYHSGGSHYVELNQIRQNKRLTDDDTMFGQVFRVSEERRFEVEKKSEPTQSQAADRFEQRIRQHRQQHKEEMEELLNVENELQKVKSSLVPVHRHSPQVTYQTPQEQHQSPPSQHRVPQTNYSRSPHAQPYSSPSRSPTRRKYVIAEARANDPPRDDRPQDISIRHIKDTLLAQSGEKYDEGRSSAEPELTWIFEKKARSVDELKSEVFNREDDCVPTVQPHRSMPGRQHPEDVADERITDYVSYYDGQTHRRPNINDPLADLERTYDHLQEQQREQHIDHRPGTFIDPGVKRLSITNVRRLEQYQPSTENPSLDYTRSWLQAPESSEVKSEDDEIFTSQPQQYHGPHYRDGDTRSSVSRTSDGHRSYPSGSALPRKVADDMAYRRQKGVPASNTRQSGSQGYVTYTTTSLTPATSQDSLSRRSVPDPVLDDAAFRKQRSSSQPTSDVSATSPPLVPNRVSTDYLEKSHERSRSAERPRNIQEISTRERRSSFSSAEPENKGRKQPPLSRGIAKMVELFNSPRELSHSAPDLVHKSVFSHKYDDQGEPTFSHETQQAHPTTPMNKARRQQTPRVVKHRHELRNKMKLQRSSTGDVEYEEYSPEKSDSYSSSGGEGHMDDRSQRSPPDGAFDADDLESQRGKNANDMKPIPITRIVSKPPTSSETAPRLPPSTRSPQMDTGPKLNMGAAVIKQREISSTGMRQWTASRPVQPQQQVNVTQQSCQGSGIPTDSPMYNMLFPTTKPQQQATQWDRPSSADSRSSVSSSDVVHKTQAPRIQFPQKTLVIDRKTSSSSSSSSPGDSPDAAPKVTAAPFPRSGVTTTTRVASADSSVPSLQASLTKPVKFTPSALRGSDRYATGGVRSPERLLGNKPLFPTNIDAPKPQQGQFSRPVNMDRPSDRAPKIVHIQSEKSSSPKQIQRPAGPPPVVPGQQAEHMPVAPQRTKHLQKKAAEEKTTRQDFTGPSQGQLSLLTLGGLLKDTAGLSIPVMGPGNDKQVHTSHSVETGDNFHKEQFSKTEFQQNRSANVQVTSSGQIVEQRQMVKQQRTVMVMSKTSKSSSTVSSPSSNQLKSSVGEKKKRKDKFDIDALVAKNAALAMSEDELENVSDYDNFTDTNLEISSDDGGSTTETGTMSECETLHDRSFSSQELNRVAEMSPDLAHEKHEQEIRQKPPGVPAEQRLSSEAEGLRKVDWGKATPKSKNEDAGMPRERRRSIKELVDNFESKMSPFS